MKKYNKILILGSAGQIGSALVNHLKNKEYDVSEMDIDITLLHDLKIKNNFSLSSKLIESDFVFFLAYDVGGSKYLEQKQYEYSFIQSNIDIMTNVFGRLNALNKPFIFASSQLAMNINSPYGVQKRLGEFYTQALNGYNVRFWNVYGVEKNLKRSHAITDFILQARDKNEIQLLTDGTEKRQFLYVEDCCEALEILMNKCDTLDNKLTFDISSYEWSTILEIANLIAQRMQCKVFPSHKKDIIHTKDLHDPNDNMKQFWIPKTNLITGINKMIDYYVYTEEGKNVKNS